MTLFHLAVFLINSSNVSLYFPPHKKQQMKEHDVPVPVDDSRMCPLQVYYDADVHDALGNLRKYF